MKTAKTATVRDLIVRVTGDSLGSVALGVTLDDLEEEVVRMMKSSFQGRGQFVGAYQNDETDDIHLSVSGTAPKDASAMARTLKKLIKDGIAGEDDNVRVRVAVSDPYIPTVRNLFNRPDLVLVTDRKGVDELKDMLGVAGEANDIDGLFISVLNGEIIEAWGFEGTVPAGEKTVILLKSCSDISPSCAGPSL